MRKMKRNIAFSSIFVLSLALLIIAMPYITKMATKSSADADPEVGKISYYKADLFDYEPSKRSKNGNFLLEGQEFNNDTNLFLFGQENYNVNPKSYGQISVPRPSEHNSWMSGYGAKVVEGLVENTLREDGSLSLTNKRVAVSGDRGVALFQTSDNTFKGSYSFPFENIGNGYLQYDSSKNHINVTSDINSDGLLKMERYDMTSEIGFMPFNKLNTSNGSNESGYYTLSGSRNYYFGMKLELPFVMPKGGKITTYNGTEEDMIFTFSGDDDIWVFVDGNLVLDLGGVHGVVSGTINFATGKVETRGNHYNEVAGIYNTNVSSVIVENETIKTLNVGRHNLQVFYLERGGNKSNCKITFRLQEDKTPQESMAPGMNVVGPTKEPVTESTSTPENLVTGRPVATTKPMELVKATDEITTEVTMIPGDITGAIDNPEVEVEYVVDVEDGAVNEIVGESVGKTDESTLIGDGVGITEDITKDSKENNDKSEGLSLFDNETPLGFLPKTGTISEVVFYVIGALFVIVAGVMVVVTVRKKK